MTATLTRTELTDHETATFHKAQLMARENSLAIGAFQTRYGQPELLTQAAELFLVALNGLVADNNIRTKALGYALEMSESRANSYGIAQATQLRELFLADLYRAAIAEREGN